MTINTIILSAIVAFAAGAGFTWSCRGEMGTLYRSRPARFWTIAVCFATCVGLAAYISQLA